MAERNTKRARTTTDIVVSKALDNTSEDDEKLSSQNLRIGLAQMLKGGVIMDVATVEQAKIAEEAGAVAVMALERIPADIRKDGGVARMTDPQLIKDIQAAVTIPVMVNQNYLLLFLFIMLFIFVVLIFDRQKPALGTLSKHKSWKLLKLTTSTKVRFLPLQMISTTSTNTTSKSPSSVDAETSVKL